MGHPPWDASPALSHRQDLTASRPTSSILITHSPRGTHSHQMFVGNRDPNPDTGR
jgi:hypothetical protein